MAERLEEVKAFDQGPELQLYTGVEYFKALREDIGATHPGDRVAVATMGFDADDPLAQEVFEHMYAAADRDVAVTFGVDAFSLMEPRAIGPVVLPLPYGRKGVQERQLALDALTRRPNAQASVINMPKGPIANLFAGRSHMKIAVVNNRVYLGGPSLQGSDRIDMVVGFDDAETADWIYGLVTEIAEKGSTVPVLGRADQERQLDSRSRILIDAGVRGQSKILEEAHRFIEEAQEWLIIGCQFLPTGKTADLLRPLAK